MGHASADPGDVPQPHVVIVGAGFGGLQAAKSLADEPVRVTVLDRNNYHAFWPLLYQVGTAQVEAGQVAYPVRSVLHKVRNIHFRVMDVDRIDRDRRIVAAGDQTVEYDYLIFAPGSRTSYLGVDGARENTLPLKSMDHGLAIRNHILERFEEVVGVTDPVQRRTLLTFVLIGAGPTGVELAGALAELVRRTFSKDYPTIDMADVRIILVEALEQVLPPFSRRAGRYAGKRLRQLGVEIRLQTKVAAVEPGAIRLEGGETIPAGTIIWTAGVTGHPLTRAAGFPTTKKGTVPVDPFLRAPDDPAVYVIGDSAYVEADGGPLPMVAQVALQEGRHAAENILREGRGRPLQPFSYTNYGMMAVLGRGRAVAERRPITIIGTLAWPIWAGIHVGQLVGFRNRLVVLINWAAAYIFSNPGVRLILPGRGEPEDPAATT